VPDEAGEDAADFDTRWDAAADDRLDAEPQGLLPQLSDELTSLHRHIETVQEDVAGLVARLQALGGAISSVEVTLGDRLSEYADTVVQLGRGLTTNVSTYREGNERTAAELRRALADSEELLRTVLTKADDLAVELATVHTELSAEGPHDALDAEELRDIVRDVVEPLDVRAAVGHLASDVAALSGRLNNELAVTTAAPASVDAAMQAELLTALEGMRAELQRVGRGDAATSKAAAAADVERERALVSELEAMREEIAGLKRRIPLRAKASGIDDPQFAALVQQISAAVVLRLPDGDVERLADAVAHRLSQAFEVVPDDESASEPAPGPTPASKPAAKAGSRTAKSSRRR
jgi:hypothetical protein